MRCFQLKTRINVHSSNGSSCKIPHFSSVCQDWKSRLIVVNRCSFIFENVPQLYHPSERYSSFNRPLHNKFFHCNFLTQTYPQSICLTSVPISPFDLRRYLNYGPRYKIKFSTMILDKNVQFNCRNYLSPIRCVQFI